MKSLFRLFLAVLLILICACSSSKVHVSSDQKIGKDVSDLRDFGIVRVNNQYPEIEREILNLVQENLENKGLRHVNKDPDFLVAVYFYSGTYEKYVPPTTFVTRSLGTDWTGNKEKISTGMGARPWSEADRMADGISKTRHSFDGYTETGFYQNIQVFFVKVINKHTMDILWRGEADKKNKKEEKLLAVAPEMIDLMIKELPH